MKLENNEYQILFDEAAKRDLEDLPKKAQSDIVELIGNLALDPRPEGVESLTNFKGLYRVRVGNYRVVYSIEDGDKVVIVAAIANRKEIYAVIGRRYKQAVRATGKVKLSRRPALRFVLQKQQFV